ncbi:MAG: LptA/OstA family protein [Candidatus Caldatribacteriaceae bacterium]
MKKFGLTIAVVFVLFGAVALAQEETPKPKEVFLESAERITYDSKNEVFNASGNVVVVQGKNRIECGELAFNLKENQGSFQKGVKVTREKTEIRALSMEGDFDREVYTFQGEVELKKEREEKGEVSTILWKTASLSYDGTSEEAWSEGQAEITWKEIRLLADRVHYFPKDETKGEKERIVLEGNVFITEEDREMQVAKAVYFLDDEILEAEGITRARFLIKEKE